MAVLTTFLQSLLIEGRLLLREPFPARPDPDAAALLEETYAVHALSVAGPAIPFDLSTAMAAAHVIYQGAWYFLNPNDVIDARQLSMPRDPRTASEHLSADLVLRLLPALYRRARALRPGDELADRLAELLRRWPLSGVLADIGDGPLTAPDFDGHPGLRMLYAERLAGHEKPAWFPTGPASETVDLVWQQLGRDTSMLPQARAVAQELAKPQAITTDEKT